jgi:hypothetical protein
MNAIVETKTVELAPGSGVFAIMIAANVLDPATLEGFVSELAERFKAQKLLSPPNTSHFLLSVRGETTAAAIKALWVARGAADMVLSVMMNGLAVADIVRAGRTGPPLEQLSLLE